MGDGLAGVTGDFAARYACIKSESDSKWFTLWRL